jgi:hypothetical protein
VSSCQQHEREQIENVVHLQNFISVDRSIGGLPFISLGKSPIFVAVPIPVQSGNNLLHALHESADRAHAVLRVFGTTLERRQRDDAVIYDNSNLFGRCEGGVGARQHCSGEGAGMIVNGYSLAHGSHETHIGIGYWSRRVQDARSGRISSREYGHRANDRPWRVKSS